MPNIVEKNIEDSQYEPLNFTVMKRRHCLHLKMMAAFACMTILLTSCEDKEDWETVTDIDGNVYKTVTIGNQVWMAENLRTTTYNDGSPIPMVENDSVWSNLTTAGYCWYNNDETTNGSTYGALYNWYAVDRFKLCPDGWIVPNDDEWRALEDYLTENGHEGAEGNTLKSTNGWPDPGNGTDNYGFNALPGGVRYGSGSYDMVGSNGYWWTSSPHTITFSGFRMLSSNSSELERLATSKKCGMSVRCIRY